MQNDIRKRLKASLALAEMNHRAENSDATKQALEAAQAALEASSTETTLLPPGEKQTTQKMAVETKVETPISPIKEESKSKAIDLAVTEAQSAADTATDAADTAEQKAEEAEDAAEVAQAAAAEAVTAAATAKKK